MQGNHTLVTGGYDGLVIVWNTDSGALSAHLSPPGLTHLGLQERSVEQVPPPQKASLHLLSSRPCEGFYEH